MLPRVVSAELGAWDTEANTVLRNADAGRNQEYAIVARQWDDNLAIPAPQRHGPLDKNERDGNEQNKPKDVEYERHGSAIVKLESEEADDQGE